MIDIDDSEIRAYITELGRLPKDLHDEVVKVGEKAALNIKKDWARAWSGHAHIPALPGAVNYDRRIRGNEIEWEIGPDKSRPQGPLGNIIEFGTVNNPPIPGGLPALDREAPRLERYLGDAVEDVLGA
ncbi:hypothetical protein [Glycomyces sp. NPDC048151]|uniref:hypothetical protein n=1 Tax=Glycomyces sp. NPDC048151 TaxID=3364002 RepID=UPI00371E7428